MTWRGATIAFLCLFQVMVGCAVVQPQPTATIQPVDSTNNSADWSVAFLHDDDIWLHDPAQNRSQKIISTEPGTLQSPAFLPDGSALLYVQANQNYYEFWLYDVALQTKTFMAAQHEQPHDLTIAPNGRFALFGVDADLFLLDLDTQEQTRIHEGATAAGVWSPNSRRFVYVTDDDRLLSREFRVTGELEEAKVLLERSLAGPTFISNQALVFETEVDGQYTVVQWQLGSDELTPLTSLRFDDAPTTVTLQRSPDATQLLYGRSTDAAKLIDVWIVHLKKDAPKLIVEHVVTPVWSPLGSAVYYVTDEPPAVYSIPVTGLTTTLVVDNASAITTTAQ